MCMRGFVCTGFEVKFVQKTPLFVEHHHSVPSEISHIDMCTYIQAKIRVYVPLYAGQVTAVPMASLL